MINDNRDIFDNQEYKKTSERINYLTLRIKILKDHIQKYEHQTDEESVDRIINQIQELEKELKIRKDFLIP
jgi:hypothetical protein